jgi:hypothetical protein
MARASAAQPASRTPAVPIDAVTGILAAFRDHEIVALGDAHGNVQAQRFLKRLVRDPRFARVHPDIVIEFGNARYQSVIDRFVRGEAVPRDSLRQAWRNTTIANEIPVDEEFFAVVRAVNASLQPPGKLRVLLGDPPIDWGAVRNRADYDHWFAMRVSYPAALIQTEVLAKQRRALVLYGQLHYQRQNLMANLDMSDWRMQTIVSLLERATPARLFTIWNADDELPAAQADVASWPVPSLAVIRGTPLGALDASAFVPTPMRFRFNGSQPLEIPRDQWRALAAEEELDAVLYLGPRASMTQMPLSSDICRDPRYVAERLRRIAVVGLPPPESDRVRQLCNTERPQPRH